MTNFILQAPSPFVGTESVADSWNEMIYALGLNMQLSSIIGGLLFLLIGYFVVKFISKTVAKLLHKTGIDKKATSKVSISQFLGKMVYYVLMAIVLLVTLSLFGVSSEVLTPLNSMVTEFFAAIPNILAAILIGFVGYFLAKIVSELVETAGDKIKSWLPKYNIDTNIDVVKILKSIVFIFIFVPILIIALEKLEMRVITAPATEMLATFINTIPTILYVAIILTVVVIGGKFVVELLKTILNGLNVNSLSKKMKLENVLGDTNLVNLATNIVYAFIIYLGVIEVAGLLGFFEVVDILNNVLAIAGKVIFGLIILALGNVVSEFAARIFTNGENVNKFLGAIVKGAVLAIFLAMGLHAMGIANHIVELAFGLSLGAIAVAFALSFGLGGREAAGEQMKAFFGKIKNEKETNKKRESEK